MLADVRDEVGAMVIEPGIVCSGKSKPKIALLMLKQLRMQKSS